MVVIPTTVNLVNILLYLLCTCFAEEWTDITSHDPVFSSKFPTRRLLLQAAPYLDPGAVHSCYMMQIKESKDSVVHMTHSFCYPALTITGVSQCSTEDLFSLLQMLPNSVKLKEKETCPFQNGQSLPEYFVKFPERILNDQIIANLCLNLDMNIRIRTVLSNPHTFYLVILLNLLNLTLS